jgi:hypothetical protein
VSLVHQPSSIIVNTGTPARYIAIAAPLLAECKPICDSVSPKVSGPKAFVARQRCYSSSVPVKYCSLPSGCRKEFTGVSGLIEG